MKTLKRPVPAALLEVWEAKKAVAADIRGMTGKELRDYLREGMEELAKELGAELVRKPDGTYVLV